MIPRYSRKAMTDIWEPRTRFKIWFEIEAHACDALAEIGVIPKDSAKAIWDKAGEASFDVARIDEIERVTKHDVIAFLTHLAEFIGADSLAFLSVEGIYRAMGEKGRDPLRPQFTDHCFTGEYPTSLTDRTAHEAPPRQLSLLAEAS